MTRSGPLYVTGVAILLTACTSSPKVRFYHIEPIDMDFAQDVPKATILALGPMSFPDYLRRPQLVRRTSGAQMIIDDFNRWAEPLDEAVSRIIAITVDGLMDDIVVLPFNSAAVDAAYRLFGIVNQFEADESGRTILVVQWGIIRTDGELTVPPSTNRYEQQATKANDPNAIPQAMTDILEAFSRDIVTMIRANR